MIECAEGLEVFLTLLDVAKELLEELIDLAFVQGLLWLIQRQGKVTLIQNHLWNVENFAEIASKWTNLVRHVC